MADNIQDLNEKIFYCDICNYPMIQWHCELICPNCGYRRDCTDN